MHLLVIESLIHIFLTYFHMYNAGGMGSWLQLVERPVLFIFIFNYDTAKFGNIDSFLTVPKAPDVWLAFC